jgi:hypothetical protein
MNDLREILLRGLAIREFTCPTCGANPTQLCASHCISVHKSPAFRLIRRNTPHDARLTAALLVYGDDFLERENIESSP